MATYPIDALPAGFRPIRTFDFARSTCREWWTVQAPDGQVSDRLCIDSPSFQASLDAFVDAALDRSGGSG